MCVIVDKGYTAGSMVGWSNVSYVHEQTKEGLHFAASSSPVNSTIFHIRPAAILLLDSSPVVNGGVVRSPKVVVTLALNHAQLLCLFFFFFVLSFLPLYVFQPPLPPTLFHLNSILFLLPHRAAC